MDIKKAYCWIALFLIIIATPQLSFFFLNKYVNTESYENRNMAQKPVLGPESYITFAKEYEEYFNDNSPYRNQLIGLNSKIDYCLFKQSSNKEVIIGENGWLFYNVALQQSLGNYGYSEERMKEIAENLQMCKNSFDYLGIEFLIFIAPNKETIYLDQAPSYYTQKNISSAEQLVRYLKEHTDIRIVYPKEELLQARKDNTDQLLYYKLDTHWNSMGAYIGAVSFARELGFYLLPINQINCSSSYIDNGDLTGMLNISIKNGDIKYDIDGYSPLNPENEITDFFTEIIYHTEGANPQNLFVKRDSFASALAPIIATQFQNSYFIHNEYYDQHQIFDYETDVFVLEDVERGISVIEDFNIAFVSSDIEIEDGVKNICLSNAIPEIELKYVSIYKTDGLTNETEEIQILQPIDNDIYLVVEEEETGKILVYVYEDAEGDKVVNQVIIEY